MATTNPEWWKEITPYLDEALELGPAERGPWLEALARRDPAAASRLRSVLADHDALAGAGFLEQPPEWPADPGADAGQRAGAYTLLHPIGAGGMGTVWLAERHDGEIQQRVAIKFLAAGRADWQERFLRERQVLASLNHPAIVHVVDAGRTADGRPYLAMEYVDGRPIDEFAESLDIRRRLDLFLLVCDAVAHAHQRLIIHRDLKPSNILVDAGGQPKLLDFGIAKLLESSGSQTQTIERLLTPQYASPEQLRGEAQTTATDIYSLAAVLYRILTGRLHRRGQTPADFLRDTDVVPPSRLNPAVPRDLDYVLRKALREEPHERYSTVEALANDVRAVLAGRPVDARAGDRWYRARTFLSRHRVAVAASVIVVAALATGFVVANRQRVIAQQRFQQVREIANEFIALDADIRSLTGSTKARNRIVSGSLKYLEALGRDARDDAGLTMEIGTAYWQIGRVQGVPFIPNLGEPREADDSLTRAEEFIGSVLASQPSHRAALLTSAQIAHDRMAIAGMQGDHAQSLAQAAKAASRLQRFVEGHSLSPEEVNTATHIYSNLAIAYQNGNRFEESIAFSERAVAVSEGVDAARMRRASALGVLGVSLRRIGDLGAALAASQQSRAILEALESPTHAEVNNLINALWREGLVLAEDGGPNLDRPDEALMVFRRALQLADDHANKDPADSTSRERIAVVSLELGNILRWSDPGEAMRVYDHALTRVRQVATNPRARRLEADLLNASTYPLRALGRTGEAGQRLAAGVQLLRDLEEFPVDQVEPLTEPYFALRAMAAQQEGIGQLDAAAATNQELIDKIESWGAKPRDDLRDATALADLWTTQARLLRALNRATEAEGFEKRRGELWQAWAQKRSDNPFVRARVLADQSMLGGRGSSR